MTLRRARLTVQGAVQGVGFRPFVYRLAHELGLAGWVLNSPQGVSIEIEGAEENLHRFRSRLETENPPASAIDSLEVSFLEPARDSGFQIRESAGGGTKSARILPDLAICADCVREIFDPADRRYLYPFANCTHCGPRFSIIEALPYDRANTSMKTFAMCPDCQREYHDPSDRRFHAQPNACPKCGPHLELWNAASRVLFKEHEALLEGARVLRAGQILALKGIGGFQLLADARNDEAVQRLRARKHREEKPFAVLFPSLSSVRECCRISALEERLLLSPQAPIVLLEKRHRDSLEFPIASSVAPANPCLGVMLPYSPLHHLLLHTVEFPVVATSGNVSDEPICIDEFEAFDRLRDIADVFLVHDRPIVRHMDDSVARIILGRELVLRAARGYAPLPITINSSLDAEMEAIFAVGAHMKNTVALKVGNQIFISQHLGDLSTEQAFAAFRQATADLPQLYETQPRWIACDLHPEYLSAKFARQQAAAPVQVQHHYAHVLSCLAENKVDSPALGICWDGTGYAADSTIWGGEFLQINEHSFERVAHFRPFRLPGGDAAVKQPRRSALGVLYEIFGPEVFDLNLPHLEHFSQTELRMLRRMLGQGINSPFTSSAGRLFDAVAALSGLRQRVSYEGQAAMELEYAIVPGISDAYDFNVTEQYPLVIDWQPAMVEILHDARQENPGLIAAKFHNMLAEIIVRIARAVGQPQVALTGGCFQNKHLTERSVLRLREEGFHPVWHRRIPPNDAGIAPGQIIAALRARQSRPENLQVACL